MAPRSMGCRNCVRRRVKCDERHPHCQRCEKAKLQCDGFREALVFVDETRQTLHRLARLQAVPTTTIASPFTGRQSPPMVQDPASELAFCGRLGLSAASEDVYLSHLLDRFIATAVQHHDYSVNRCWMVTCLSKPERYPTAALAIKCLATSFFGRKHRQDSIIAAGGKAYGRALVALRQTLQDPVRAWTFDALAATTALAQYEYVMFTTRRGWMQHCQGVAKLIEARGPERFRRWPDRAILEANKGILITQALIARRRSFLEDAEWRGVHGPNEVGEKHFASSLNDIFAKLPGIAETVQQVESGSVDPAQVTDTVELTRRKMSNLIQELDDWYASLTRRFGQVAIEKPAEPGSGISIDTEGPLFDTLFEFANLEMADAFVNHHAIKIAALEWQHKLTDLTWQRGVDHEGMQEIPAASQLSLEICRSVEYLLRPTHAQSGSFYMVMPARVAHYALQKSSREARWLARVLHNIADTSGFEMARNVVDNIPIRKVKVVEGQIVLQDSPASSESTIQSTVSSRPRSTDAS